MVAQSRFPLFLLGFASPQVLDGKSAGSREQSRDVNHRVTNLIEKFDAMAAVES
jgi:hypothetical protein